MKTPPLEVNSWIGEDLQVVCSSIKFLHLDCTVICKKPSDIKILCSGLASVQRWKIETLDLYSASTDEEGCALLTEVASGGTVESFHVGLSGLKRASQNQIKTLSNWGATEKEWTDVEGQMDGHTEYHKDIRTGNASWGSGGNTLAQKNWGEYGLQQLLAWQEK